MSFFDQLGQLGGSVIGTVDDLVDAYGDNAANATSADAVRIRSAQSQIAINEARAAAEIDSRRRLNSIISTSVYLLLLLVAILVAANVYKNVK